MIAGIVAVPSRAEAVEHIRLLIEPSVDQFLVFWDHDRRGTYWNQSRAYQDTLARAKPGEPVLMLTDDVTTVPDWRDRWEAIHAKARTSHYCLFTRRRHLLKPDNLKRGYVTALHPRGFYDQAVIVVDDPTFMDDALAWAKTVDQSSRYIANRMKHLDVVMQDYLVAQDRPWTVTVPTLFDHRRIASTLGHTVGASPDYIGDRL